MKRIILSLFVCLMLSCSTIHTNISSNGFDSTHITYDTIHTSQFDSLCKILLIPTEDSLWLKTYYRDFETSKKVIRKMFILRMDSIETIYMAMPLGNDSIQIKIKQSL